MYWARPRFESESHARSIRPAAFPSMAKDAFVIGENRRSSGRRWCVMVSIADAGICAVMASIGARSRYALATAVAKFVAPGPKSRSADAGDSRDLSNHLRHPGRACLMAGQQEANPGAAAGIDERDDLAARQSEDVLHSSRGQCVGHPFSVSGHYSAVAEDRGFGKVVEMQNGVGQHVELAEVLPAIAGIGGEHHHAALARPGHRRSPGGCGFRRRPSSVRSAPISSVPGNASAPIVAVVLRHAQQRTVGLADRHDLLRVAVEDGMRGLQDLGFHDGSGRVECGRGARGVHGSRDAEFGGEEAGRAQRDQHAAAR